MKRLLIFLTSLLLFDQLSAQIYTPMPPWYEFFQAKFRVLGLPKTQPTGAKDTAFVYYRKVDSTLQMWTGYQWIAVGGPDGSKVPLGRSITINGTTKDLATDQIWNITKADVGLPFAENTSDLNKPVSTAQQAALDDSSAAIRAAIATANPTASSGITKSGNDFRLGQDSAQSGAPAALPSTKEIPLNGKNIFFSGTVGNVIVGSGNNGVFVRHPRNAARVAINDSSRNALLSVGPEIFSSGTTSRDRRSTVTMYYPDTIRNSTDFVEGMARGLDVQKRSYINNSNLTINTTVVASNSAARAVYNMYGKEMTTLGNSGSAFFSALRGDLAFNQYPGFSGVTRYTTEGLTGLKGNILDGLSAVNAIIRTNNNGGSNRVRVQGHLSGFMPYFELAANDTIDNLSSYTSGYVYNNAGSKIPQYSAFRAALGFQSPTGIDSIYGYRQDFYANAKNYFGNPLGIGTGRLSPRGNLDVRDHGYIDTVNTNIINPIVSSDTDFEFVVIPDPQVATWMSPSTLSTTFDWIVANKTSANIKGVFCVGDNTEHANTTEFTRISNEFAKLDAQSIPILTVLGNHDYNSENPASRATTQWNTYFGTSRFSGKSYYGGGYSGSNDNYYIRIPVGTVTYLVLGLEFFPRDAVVTWAQGIINANPTDKVIIVTHGYLDAYLRRSTDSSVYGPRHYSLGADNSGQELWDKLIKWNKNIIMVFGGHFTPLPDQTTATLFHQIDDVGVNGNVVHQFIYNAQNLMSTYGGGYFMRLKFKPSKGKVDIAFYSNSLFQSDPHHADYTISLNTVGVSSSLGVVGNIGASGSVYASSLQSDTIYAKNILGNKLRLGNFVPGVNIPAASTTLQLNGSISLQKDSIRILSNLNPVYLYAMDTTEGGTTTISRIPASSFSASNAVLTTGNQTVAGIKTFTDRMSIIKGSGVTPDVNNLLYIGRNEPGNFYPLFIIEDKTNDGYAQFGYWGKDRRWNVGVGNGGGSFFNVADKYYILDATSNNIRFVIDPNGRTGIGGITDMNSFLHVPAGTSAAASLTIPETSTAPTSPSAGQIWNLNGKLTFRTGSTDKVLNDFEGGIYNPTFSNLGSGVTSVSATGSKVWFTRNDKTLTVTGKLGVVLGSATAGDTRTFTMSLPPGMTANFTATSDAGGIANCTFSTTHTAEPTSDATNDIIRFTITVGSNIATTANLGLNFTVSFEIL